jgi:hypothetical protein
MSTEFALYSKLDILEIEHVQCAFKGPVSLRHGQVRGSHAGLLRSAMQLRPVSKQRRLRR